VNASAGNLSRCTHRLRHTPLAITIFTARSPLVVNSDSSHCRRGSWKREKTPLARLNGAHERRHRERLKGKRGGKRSRATEAQEDDDGGVGGDECAAREQSAFE